MSLRATSWVWQNARVDGTALLLLLAIADYANADGEAWPTVNTLAARCRLSQRQVRRLLVCLAATGHLSVITCAGPASANTYVVPINPDLSAGPSGGDIGVRGPDIQGTLPREGADIQGIPLKGIEPSEIAIYREVEKLDRHLRRCPGYDPDEQFYRKVLQNYSGLDLEEEGMRIAGWFAEPANRKRLCTHGFVLGWLRRELQRAQDPALRTKPPRAREEGHLDRNDDLGGTDGLEIFV